MGDILTQSFSKSIRDNSPTSKEAFLKFLKSPIGASVGSGVITLFVLMLLKPPMVQKKTSGIQRNETDLGKVLKWSLFVSALVFVGPLSSNKNATNA